MTTPAALALVLAAAAQDVPPVDERAAQDPAAPEPAGPAAAARRAAAEASWAGFPAFLWRQDFFGEEAPAELLEGLGGTNVERDRDEPWVRARGLDFYVGHGPGRDELHLDKDRGPWAELWPAWVADRDPARLVRPPCLTDPATVETLRAALARTLDARGGHHGVGVSLGDEVSLTPFGDPFDLCFSPTCAEAWRELSGRELEGDVDAAVLTDAVRLAVGEGRTGAIGPWLAKRAFHRDIVMARLEELADQVREQAPGAGVGLLGVTGSTAFGGLPVDRCAALVDFFEGYAVGDTRELFDTLRRPDQRTLTTVFPDPGNPDGAAWQVWEHVLRGGDGVVVWSDRTLARDEAFAARLREALADARRVRAALPDFDPRPAGVAVVHDPRAVAAAWLRDALLDGPTWPSRFAGYQETHGTRERALRAWLRLLEDAGLLPGSVPLERVVAATAARFPVLVLVHQLVLDPADLRRLGAYLDAGGTLVVDGELGWIDASGAKLEGAPLRGLRERSADRVLDAPDGLDRYERARADPEGLAPRLRATVRAWLEPRARDLLPPWRLTGDAAEIPWLAASQRQPDGTVLGALLPNWTTPRERARHLRALELELVVPAGRTLEWLHPPAPPGTRELTLPPGDAAVFRLARRSRDAAPR